MGDADAREYALLSMLPNSLHQRIMFLSVCAVMMEERRTRRNDQENALNIPVPRENIPIHFGNFNPLNFPLVLNQSQC